MCGLVGVGGWMTTFPKNAFRDLLHLDYLRGRDSTGIASVQLENKNIPYKENVFKTIGGPWNIYDKYIKDFHENGQIVSNPDIIIGHNRHATQGKIDKESAHPFRFSNIIGAHNGTVDQKSIKHCHDADRYSIDSQIIFSQINNNPDLNIVWEKADGALALVWWDKRDGSLHFARNNERSLFYTIDEKKSRIFWASEEWMLKVALSKNQLECKEIHSFEENVHYKMNMCKLALEFTKEELKTPPLLKISHYNSGYKDYDLGERNNFFSKNKETYSKLRFYITEMCDTEYGPFFYGKSTTGLNIVVDGPIKGDKNYEESVDRIKKCSTNDLWEVSWDKTSYKQDGSNFYYIIDHEDINLVFNKKEEQKEIHNKFTRECKGFKGEKLSKSDFEERLKEGCSNCLEVIEWGERFKIRWIDKDHAYCQSCVTLPSIKQELQRIYGGAKDA